MKRYTVFLLFIILLSLINPAKFKEIDEYNYYWVTDSLFSGKGITIHQGLLLGIRNNRQGQFFYGKEGIDGFYSPYGPLMSFIACPTYYISHIMSGYLELNEVQREVLLWYSSIMLNIFLLLIIVYLLYYVHKLSSEKSSAVMMVLLVSGSLLLYYTQTFYADILLSFLVMASFLFMILKREDTYYFLSGFFFGLSVVTKINALIFAPCFLLYLWLEERDKKLLFKKLFMFFLPVMFFLMFYLNYNYVRFGSLFDFGYPEVDEFGESMNVFIGNPIRGMITQAFSPGKGIIFYFPMIILYLINIKKYIKKNRNITLFCLSTVIVSLVFYSFWKHYEGGTCFGSRFLVTGVLMVLFNIAVAGNLKEMLYNTRVKRYLFIFLLTAGIIVNLGGSLVDFSYYSINVNGHYYTGPDDPEIQSRLPEYLWRFAGDYNTGFSPFFGMYGYMLKNFRDLGDIEQCALDYDYDRLYISSFEYGCFGRDLDVSAVNLYKTGMGFKKIIGIYLFSGVLCLVILVITKRILAVLRR